jgi:tRNA G18 (ribose-2'-O)-methylase SpoU
MQVILDDIRSVQNVATIFRSSDGIGVSKIWLGGYTPGPLDKYGIVIPKFSRISLGAEESLKWAEVRDVCELIENLRGEGKFVIGVETGSRAVEYNDLELEDVDFENVVLVMGSETDGLSDEVLDECDLVMEIPMNGEKISLNVAVAFSIAGFVVRDFVL